MVFSGQRSREWQESVGVESWELKLDSGLKFGYILRNKLAIVRKCQNYELTFFSSELDFWEKKSELRKFEKIVSLQVSISLFLSLSQKCETKIEITVAFLYFLSHGRNRFSDKAHFASTEKYSRMDGWMDGW